MRCCEIQHNLQPPPTHLARTYARRRLRPGFAPRRATMVEHSNDTVATDAVANDTVVYLHNRGGARSVDATFGPRGSPKCQCCRCCKSWLLRALEKCARLYLATPQRCGAARHYRRPATGVRVRPIFEDVQERSRLSVRSRSPSVVRTPGVKPLWHW